MYDGELGPRPWSWCLRRYKKEKGISRSYRYMAGVRRINLLCVPCVCGSPVPDKKEGWLFSLFSTLPLNTHTVTHTQKQRQKQPGMRRWRTGAQALRCWSKDRENKDGRSLFHVAMFDVSNGREWHCKYDVTVVSLSLTHSLFLIPEKSNPVYCRFLHYSGYPPLLFFFSPSLILSVFLNKEPFDLVKQMAPWYHLTPPSKCHWPQMK